MAAEGEHQGDVRAHERSYFLFIGLMKWGAIVIFILTALVIVLIRA